jgi:hypothetical protein
VLVLDLVEKESRTIDTDSIPKLAVDKEEYSRSDLLRTIHVPGPEPFRALAIQLKEALASENRKELQLVCNALARELADFYKVAPPPVKILNTRPRKVSEGWMTEFFGDYDPETTQIRLWMRTAVQKKPTSYGVLLSTFCHEFFHHFDMVGLNFPNTFHTRGFYERVGLLYHHIQNTPVRSIAWKKMADGTYSVDWGRTMAGRRKP